MNRQNLRPITYVHNIRRPGPIIGDPEPPVAWIQFAVQQPSTRLLRVLIYARYSTDDQNPHSIDAQIAYCKRFLSRTGDYGLRTCRTPGRRIVRGAERASRHQPGVERD